MRLVKQPVVMIMTMVLIINILSIRTFASVSPGPGISYTVENGQLLITGTGQMTDFSGNNFNAPWQEYSGSITSVVVGDGVESIGSEAFYNMHLLERVSLADSVKSIGAAAFANCSRLTDFSAEGIASIAPYAFQNTAISVFNIPASVMSISDLAFFSADIGSFSVDRDNRFFSSINGALFNKNGSTLLRYPNGALEDSYNIPKGAAVIGRHAFQGSALKTVGLGNIIEIKESAFQSCSKLSDIVFPDSVKTVEQYAFYMCNRLSSVLLNEGLTNIEQYAFAGCSNIKSVDIPKTALFIHHKAFPKSVKLNCLSERLTAYGINGYRIADEIFISCQRDYDSAFELLSIANEERFKAFLPDIVMNKDLMNYAMKRAVEVAVYPSNIRPDSSESQGSFKSKDVTYVYETFVENQNSADKAYKAFNLIERFKEEMSLEQTYVAGVGCIRQNDKSYWVFIFGKANDAYNCPKPNNTMVDEKVNLAVGTYYPTVVPSISFSWEVIDPTKSSIARLCFKGDAGEERIFISGENSNFKWSASDDYVVEISVKNGVCNIRGRSDGTSVITARSLSGYIVCAGTISVGTGKTIEMHRLFNPQSGEHLYTVDEMERTILNIAGWTYEGRAWYAPERSKKPVYRLYNKTTGDHHYTMDSYEKDVLCKNEWAYEGIGWYSDPLKGKPLYRLYNPKLTIGAHHYTADEHEKNTLVSLGWEYEGICWYGQDAVNKDK